MGDNNMFFDIFKKKKSPPIIRLLSKFKNIKKFESYKQLTQGLLKYSRYTIPKDTAFLFKFEESDILFFHTINMKINIDIYFFDSNGDLVNKVLNCEPGMRDISSMKPAKYAVEFLSGELKNEEEI